jgi:hypothetical protein
VTCWSENFDGVTAPALPLAWTTATLSGAANPWTTVASTPDTAPNRVAAGSPANVSDSYVRSQWITLPPGARTLTFRHSFNTEAGYDGGVLEIASQSQLGLGTWSDIVSAGGSFAAGGYNNTISNGFGNPLAGRQAWSGNSGGFITTTVNLPNSLPSSTVKLRFRIGTDSSAGGAGWSVDTMSIAVDPCGAGGTSPGAFSKIFPEHHVIAQGTTPVYHSTSPTLSWAPSVGAAGYQYCIHTTNDNSCDPWINVGMATSVTVTGLAPGTYHYWHVKALDPSLGPSTYANASQTAFWRFMTLPDPPAAFSKTSPLASATNRPTTLTLNWSASAGATSYEYCIDTIDDGVCGSVWEPAGMNTSVLIRNLDPATLHSWEVRAIGPGGTTYADGGPTAFSAFTTALLSRVPLIDLDGNGSGDVFVQELSSGAWLWERYKTGGGFIESGGNQGPDVTTTLLNNMYYDGVVDARTDAFRFNSVTGQWYRNLNDGNTFSSNVGDGIWWQGWQRHVTNLDGDAASDIFLYDPATGVWFQCLATNACYQGGWNPGWEIYAARLNNDAFGDFFLIDRNTGRWFWALGTGPGSWSFTYPVTETWFSGWKIYPGDFNGDGLTDFLLHDPNTGVYFVAFTQPAGGFTYASGGWAAAWQPIVADINGDGKDDVFRHDSTTGNWSETISDGLGGFTKSGNMGTWSLGWQVHPTDFNGDGKADFFLYHAGTGVWYQAINTGPGTFAYTSGNWKAGLTISTGAIGR